jgi:hypothetical protein
MKAKVKKHLSSKQFRANAKAFIYKYSKHISEKKAGDIIQKNQLENLIKKMTVEDFDVKFLVKQNRFIDGIIKDKIKNSGIKLDDILADESQEKIKELLSEPYTLPQDLVRQFLKQDAIQQLFITIITDSIIGFNKKINPFSGLTTALGLETQIKNFLKPFMGQVLDSSAKFIMSKNNEVLFTKMSASMFDIIKKENLTPYLDSISQTQKDKYDELMVALSKDQELAVFLQDLSLEILNQYYDKLKDIKIKEFYKLTPDEYADKYADSILDYLIPLIQDDIVVEFLADEIDAISKI